MSDREWFTGGVSRVIRDVMLLFVALDLLGMAVRQMAMRPYADSLALILLWLLVYVVAWLFRRRA